MKTAFCPKKRTGSEDEFPSAQVQKEKPTTSNKQRFKQPKERHSNSSHQYNGLGLKRHRDDKSAKTNGSTDVKRSRQEEELSSIEERITSSNNSIGFLKNHLEKGT